jgi:hypothetical protein
MGTIFPLRLIRKVSWLFSGYERMEIGERAPFGSIPIRRAVALPPLPQLSARPGRSVLRSAGSSFHSGSSL